MKIGIPKLSLVVLFGPSGSGKSTFASKHLLPTQVISSVRLPDRPTAGAVLNELLVRVRLSNTKG